MLSEQCDLSLLEGKYMHLFSQCGIARIKVENLTNAELNEEATEMLAGGSCGQPVDGKIKPFVYDEAHILLLNYGARSKVQNTCVLKVGSLESQFISYDQCHWAFLGNEEDKYSDGTYSYSEQSKASPVCNGESAIFDAHIKRLYMDQKTTNEAEYSSIFDISPTATKTVYTNVSSGDPCVSDDEIAARQIDPTWTSEDRRPHDIHEGFFNQLYEEIVLWAERKDESEEYVLKADFPSKENYSDFINSTLGVRQPMLHRNYSCIMREMNAEETMEYPRMLVMNALPPALEDDEKLLHDETMAVLDNGPFAQQIPQSPPQSYEQGLIEQAVGKRPILANYFTEVPLCNYSMFSNDYLHVFTSCGIISVEMATIDNNATLEARIAELQNHGASCNKSRPSVKPFYYNPEALLLVDYWSLSKNNTAVEVEVAIVELPNNGSRFFAYPQNWRKVLQRRTWDQYSVYNITSGQICDPEHSVYLSLTKRWLFDCVPGITNSCGQIGFTNATLNRLHFYPDKRDYFRSEGCMSYTESVEKQNDPTMYHHMNWIDAALVARRFRVGEGYPREMVKNNLHYDSTRQMTVLNMVTKQWDQIILYPSNFPAYDHFARGPNLGYTFDRACRIRSDQGGGNHRFMLIPKDYDELM
ncbi:hypothetical protein QR680_011045 [Steinernema hermaphroditum]|uniref:Uncharacterized protein n=1 Tax=Steinernema hermaphroditum TaxID=289476 RepID=A0AA39ITF2_9BILA|nr:hypothetical protein QR680_011045 [Steinernema hermaphroditum]